MASTGQMSLFAFSEETKPQKTPLPDIPEYDDKLRLALEKRTAALTVRGALFTDGHFSHDLLQIFPGLL